MTLFIAFFFFLGFVVSLLGAYLAELTLIWWRSRRKGGRR